MPRFHSTAGIAIGPILFVIALLGILAMAMAAGSGGFGSAGVADRVTADIVSQVNLIRGQINGCQLQYITTAVDNSTAAPWASVTACAYDHWPCSDQTNGTAVINLTCPGDPLTSGSQQPNLWTGPRAALLPQPTQGFNAWTYINAGDTHGRCIWTTPVSVGGTSNGQGLARAAAKFSSQESAYNATTQKFVVFITLPSGSTNTNCVP
jgi:hypothetical protein